MKKIFAISVLSVLAVVAASDAWATQSNYNLATVNYVENFGYDLKTSMVEDRNIVDSQGKNWNDEDATTWAETYPDGYVPTIGRMNAAIADAVADVDTSGLVDKAAVVISGGGRTMTGGAVATDANKDAYVPTVAYAQEMATSAASGAVAELEPKFEERVPYATGIADGFLVTDSTGNVYVNHGVPSSISDAMDEKISLKLDKPMGECAEIGACALVFAGFGEDGAPLLQWEKIARSVAEQTAE